MINSVSYMGKKFVGKWRPASGLPIACISLTDPGSKKIDFEWHDGPLLELQFFDVRNEFYEEPSILPGPTAEIATTIRSFIDEISTRENSFDLLVNCHEGISRSAAVAKYVSEKFRVASYSPILQDLSCHNRELLMFLTNSKVQKQYGQRPP